MASPTADNPVKSDPRIEVDVDSIMKSIREELSRTRAGFIEGRMHPGAQHQISFQELDEYLLTDLLRYHGEEFVRKVYRSILHREPDSEGLEYCVSMLRAKNLSKVDLVRQIRFSREGMQAGVTVWPLSGNVLFIPEPLFVPVDPDGSIAAVEHANGYTLTDFCRLHDGAFVRNAYLRLLRREPDARGFEEYLDALRCGRLLKSEILEALRYSDEGRAANVFVHGLARHRWLRRLQRVPLVGRALGIAKAALHLPEYVRNIERQEARLEYFKAHSGEEWLRLQERLARSISDLEELQQRVAAGLSGVEDSASIRAWLRRIAATLEDMSWQVRAQQNDKADTADLTTPD
jgi:Domain of unknown function (DUF4214)